MMMRMVDVLYAIPYMMIVIVLLAFFGGQSPFGQLVLLFVALGAVRGSRWRASSADR